MNKERKISLSSKIGDPWQLLTEADTAQQANLLVRLGKDALPFSESVSNVLGVTDA
ncbi:hypothetical protein [Bacillus sp. 3255]|uniref:hypothetical protein n=1 Tax=Bacillus sp. 3255 TaxID=2817904 RepID=UPI00286AA732|nr:hypothetical protein [Bacillus sp. 3255]